MLLFIILATFIVSLISFSGLVFVGDVIKKYLHYLVSFSAATLLAVAFFDLLPESITEFIKIGVSIREAFLFVLIGVLFFFLIERVIHWHHCDSCGVVEHSHHSHHASGSVGLLILTGDFFHNFVDGVIIAGAFLLDFRAGILTTVSIVAHEIPQEIGDFTVLLHGGYSKRKALLFNFYSGLSSVLGGVIGYYALSTAETIIPYAVAIGAGGFIYIALTHIVPALHSHKNNRKMVLVETIIFFVTLVLFYFLLA